jgi:hypothetical protein
LAGYSPLRIIDVAGRLAVLVDVVSAVGDPAARGDEVAT